MAAVTDELVYCEAAFNYQDGDDRRAVSQRVLDGRRAPRPDFETCGFDLLEHPSEVADWSDQDEVDRVNGPEVEALALSQTGCDTAIAFSALLRSRVLSQAVPDHGPIEFVHSDFTDDYGAMICDPERTYAAVVGPLLAGRGLGQDDLRGASRLMILQFWRNTGPRAPDLPLAVCDGSTVPVDRLRRFVVHEYGGTVLDFEVFGVAPPASGEHDSWFTFPLLGRDEVIALRTFDSRCVAEGRSYWTPHSAFVDPHVVPGSAPRESVERRVLCIWS